MIEALALILFGILIGVFVGMAAYRAVISDSKMNKRKLKEENWLDFIG